MVDIPDTLDGYRVTDIGPQAFSYSLIRAAYEIMLEEGMQGITDDAMVVEASRLSRVKLVMGAYTNIKITTPDDLK